MVRRTTTTSVSRYAKEYFDQIEANRSLVFYYSNYSNPFSEDDSRRYVIVGVSRVKSVGKIRNYTDMTPEDRKKYGGGFVWGLDLTSHYPDQGLRLPYHAYLDRPDEAERFIVVPPNPRNFKYATRQFDDDDALEIIEAMIDSVSTLVEMGDASEQWDARLDWLHSVVGELWTERGLFPGLPPVLDHLGIPQGDRVLQGENGRRWRARSERRDLRVPGGRERQRHLNSA